MTERKRNPNYRPLLAEEDEPIPETNDLSYGHSHRDSRSPVRHVNTGPDSDSPQPQGEYVERVLILSDHEEDGGNGDADSGISLSEIAGEEHPASGRSKQLVVEAKRSESLLMLMLQIVIPFFFAGFGMMTAGLLLDAVQVRSGTCGWPGTLAGCFKGTLSCRFLCYVAMVCVNWNMYQ